MKLLAISGSLRQDSYNTRLLELAETCLPAGVTYQLYRYDQLPLYNQDLDGAEKPPAVTSLLETIAAADGLLISTPEYNYSIPGGLKNTLDWASRPAFKSVLKNKPTGLLSASMSPLGGVRAQIHLKQILAATLTPLFPAADFLLPTAQQAFSPDGSSSDPELTIRLRSYLQELVSWMQNYRT